MEVCWRLRQPLRLLTTQDTWQVPAVNCCIALYMHSPALQRTQHPGCMQTSLRPCCMVAFLPQSQHSWAGSAGVTALARQH